MENGHFLLNDFHKISIEEMHFSGELSTPFSGFGDRKSESQTVLIPESVKMMLLLYLEYQIMKFLQFGLDFYYLYFFLF